MVNVFKIFCERAKFEVDIELEIEIDSSNFNGTEGPIYYWYLGKLIAIEHFKPPLHNIYFTDNGKVLLSREASKLLKERLC